MTETTGDGPGPPPKSFGLSTATFVVIASMIGTGVLTTSGFTVAEVGSNQIMLLLWFVGGLVAICGALTLAELAAALPHSGGDYVFLREAYGPLLGFLGGWVSFLIGFGAPIASSAFAAGKYLLAPLDLPDDRAVFMQKLVGTVIIVVFSLAHGTSREGTIRLQGGVTLLKLAILGALAAAGIAAGWGGLANLADSPPIGRIDWVGAFGSMIFIAYAYTGWNGAGYIGGEVDDPQRRLPIAIFLGTGVVLIVYLALNVFYALALSADEVRAIAASGGDIAQIAGLAAARVFGAGVTDAISLAIGMTLLASLSAFILTGPRVVQAMAVAGQFPAFAGRLHGRGQTPAIATALQGGWAIALLWFGRFDDIIKFAGVGLALFSLLTVAAIYVLRVRQPELARPFRTPGYPWVPALYLIVTIALTAATFAESRRPSTLALSCILAGVPSYYLWVRLRG